MTDRSPIAALAKKWLERLARRYCVVECDNEARDLVEAMTESNRAPADPRKVLEELMGRPPRRSQPEPESPEERELREFEAEWQLSEAAQKKFVSRYAEGSVNLHFGRYKTTEDLDRDRERIFGALEVTLLTNHERSCHQRSET